MFQTEHLQKKKSGNLILEHPELPKISDGYRQRHYNHSREPRKRKHKRR